MTSNKEHVDNKSSINSTKFLNAISVIFATINGICENFSSRGLQTILSIYLSDVLLYKKSDAKVVYHAFISLIYIFHFFGFAIANNTLGKFYAILCIPLVCVTGNVLLSVAVAPSVQMDTRTLSLLALFLIAVGSGGVRPYSIKIGEHQDKKQSEKDTKENKSVAFYYISIYIAVFYSIIFMPLIRETPCLGEDNCFVAVFAVSAGLMTFSIVAFIIGKFSYTTKKMEETMVVKVLKCIMNAFNEKRKSNELKKHWLDYAENKYGQKFVSEVKRLLTGLKFCLRFTVYWTLFDQRGSSWTLQARSMANNTSFVNILPDQMQVTYFLFLSLFSSTLEYIIYPLFKKIHFLTTPLHRIVTGGLLLASSFFISGVISLNLEAEVPLQPTNGVGHLRVYNNMPCKLYFETNAPFATIVIPQNECYEKNDIKVKGIGKYDYRYTCQVGPVYYGNSGQFSVIESTAVGYYFSSPNNLTEFIDRNQKSNNGYPKIRTLINTMDRDMADLNVSYYNKLNSLKLLTNLGDIKFHHFKPELMHIRMGTSKFKFEPKLGGVYVIVATAYSETLFNASVVTVTPPNDLHILWQLPQYAFFTMGDIMFTIATLGYACRLVPTDMQSVVGAAWLLMAALGNMLVVIIEALQLFKDESSILFFYGALMVAGMIELVLEYYYTRYTSIGNKRKNEKAGKENQPQGVHNPDFKRTE